MSTSALATQLDAICDGLAARPGLAEVNVFTGAVAQEEAGLECVVIGGTCELDEIAHSMGGNREETWRVDGAVRVIKEWQGSTEDTIRAARDRLMEILAEIETYLNDTYAGTLPDAQLMSGTLDNAIWPEGRLCGLVFSFELMTVKTP